LRAYRVLDTEPEAAYEALARLAASVCGTAIALVSLIDESRQWFKANHGLDGIAQTPRKGAFCDHTIRGRDVFEVADARADERFAANPLVATGRPVCFYAGAPLVTPDGDAVGTICVLDRHPGALTAEQREQLALLAGMTIGELERRKRVLRLADDLANVSAESQRRRRELLEARSTQADLVARLARDVRGPVTSIVGFARLLEEDGRFPADAREALAVVRASGERIGEIASDVDLLSRIELAAVEPQWRTVDLAALAASAGAVVDQRTAPARVVADPDLLGTVLGRLVEDGGRALAPVRARIEDLGEAVVLELSGDGASPAGDEAAPTIGGRLAARVMERHTGSYRPGGSAGAWWVRLTLPYDPRRAPRSLRVVVAGPPDGRDELCEQLRALGFGVETVDAAAQVRDAAPVDVVVFSGGRGAWADRERLPPALRRRVGLVALSPGEQRAGDGWDALVAAGALPADLSAAVYAAAAKARARRSEDGLVASNR
jgi:GAF domain-containing protein